MYNVYITYRANLRNKFHIQKQFVIRLIYTKKHIPDSFLITSSAYRGGFGELYNNNSAHSAPYNEKL